MTGVIVEVIALLWGSDLDRIFRILEKMCRVEESAHKRRYKTYNARIRSVGSRQKCWTSANRVNVS